jgi:hypothetical protein
MARHRGLTVVGTLAALDIAAADGLVELQTMFESCSLDFRCRCRSHVSTSSSSMANVSGSRGDSSTVDVSGLFVSCGLRGGCVPVFPS